MRFAILVAMVGRRAGGPETYERHLIRSLAALDHHNEYDILCPDTAAKEALQLSQDNVHVRVLWPRIRQLSVALSLPVHLLTRRVDLLHATFIPPPFSPIPYVFTMHDTSMFDHPEFYHPAHVRRLHALISIALRRARRVVCVSKQTLTMVAERFRLPHDRLRVVYHGVESRFQPIARDEVRRRLQEELGIEWPYVLFVGQLKTRSKNLVRLMEAFDRVRRQGHPDLRLVLVGRRGATSERLDETIHRLGIRNVLHEVGHVPTEHLPLLYNGAALLCLPSLVEGFGLPVLEAMACATPVVTSNLSCLPEIAGGAAVLVDPHSVDAIADGIHRALIDSTLRETLREKGLQRASLFTWERTAQQTLEVYREVIGS